MLVALLAGLVAAATIFSAVFFLTALRVGGLGRGGIAGRLSKYNEIKVEPHAPRRSWRNRERSKATELLVKTVDRVVENQSFAEKLREAIARADLRFTVGEYLILWVTVIILCVFVGQVILKDTIETVVLVAAGVAGPRWFLYYRAAQRLKKFNNQLADTIIMMANSLRSGYSVLQSMELVSREMAPPINQEFARVIKEVQIGLSPEDGLANMVRRIRSLDLEMMVMAINVQREIGGNLSVILDTIAHTIRERVRIKGEIKTLTAQATLSGYIITFLPLGLAFVIYTIDHRYISFFWTDRGCGLPMMIASLCFMAVGGFIMRRITQIEV